MKFILRSINEYKIDEMTMNNWFKAVDTENIKLIKEYLENGFDINCKDISGDTALILACKFDKLEIVKELLKHFDIDVNLKNEFNDYFALIYACDLNEPEIVKELLKHPNINVNLTDMDGVTPLIWACYTDSLEIVKELLKHPDINLNIKDDDGCTALHYAKNRNNQEMIDLLVKEGA